MTDYINRRRIYPDGDKTITPNVNRIANRCCICGIEILEGNHTCTACRRFYLTAPERYRVLTMPPKKVCGLLEEDD